MCTVCEGFILKAIRGREGVNIPTSSIKMYLSVYGMLTSEIYLSL